MSGIQIKGRLPTDDELKRMFDAVPALERYRVGDRVVRAGVKPITKRSQQLMPRSSPEDRAKWSNERKSGSGRWGGLNEPPLWRTVKLVVRKLGDGGAVAVTGPEYTGKLAGSGKIYFVAEHKRKTRRKILWGHDSGKTVQKIRNVMKQAADETRPAQLAAMKAELKTAMDAVWRG